MNRFFARTTIVATFALSTIASAQSGRMTAAEYDRAVNFLAPNLTGLVIGGTVNPGWLPDGRFWYRAQTQAGSEFRLVSPAAKRMAPAFDHQKLANALSSVSGSASSPTQLPFQSITFSVRMDSVSFNVGQRQFRCDVGGNGCVAAGAASDAGGRGGRGGRAGGGGGGRGGAGPTVAMSPDGRSAAFVRNWNLWIRDVATGRERQLTTDGVNQLRLRHRQRRLAHRRPSHDPVVAGLEEDRDAAAGRTERRRDALAHDGGRSPNVAFVEVPAPRRQRRRHDPARGHRGRKRSRRQAPDAARLSTALRSATTSA